MQRRVEYIVIVFVALIVQGVVVFNDGIYLDDWLIYTDLIEGNWEALSSWVIQAGQPGHLYFYWLMGYLPGLIFKFRMVAFLSILLTALLVYKICEESKLTSRWESVFIALISLTYPAFQVSIATCVTPYLVFYESIPFLVEIPKRPRCSSHATRMSFWLGALPSSVCRAA